MFSLHGKTVVITGAGSGIGRAIALLFAKQGARIEILDVNSADAEGVVSEIRAAGGGAGWQICDVGDQAAVKAVFGKIEGKIDILVNNAGIAHIGTVLTTTEADMDKLYRINIKGVYNCMNAAVERMVNQGGGVVLNMCSIASIMGLPDRFAYSMTKGAVEVMTYSVAKDFIKMGIRCNCICPARVHTPFVDGYLAKTYPGQEAEMFEKLSQAQPIGRMAVPDEVASLALYLCSDEASFVTGCAYPIDGGAVNLR
jgi:2-keto-3-deoxy-L-fuconate dehydrogenase